MLKIAKPSECRFDWPVDVYAPEDGEKQKHRFTATFTRLSQSELEEIERGASTQEILRRHLVGWADLYDADGKALPYNDDTKALVLDDVVVVRALVRALWEAHDGRGAERKN